MKLTQMVAVRSAEGEFYAASTDIVQAYHIALATTATQLRIE